jgi:hypothetical protein
LLYINGKPKNGDFPLRERWPRTPGSDVGQPE